MKKQPALWMPRPIAVSLLIYAILHLSSAFFLPQNLTSGWLAGYFLGLLAVVLHYGFSIFAQRADDARFAKIFLAGLLIRFLIILTLFVFLLLSENFDQFGFTVAFLISYIFHSVNDVILLNKKLTNHTG
ncbi:MAG: hypothetical protein R3283_01335 [Balneolaceae bacterium]|nr:hypothetical protein [Balneolaceae bacterium]